MADIFDFSKLARRAGQAGRPGAEEPGRADPARSSGPEGSSESKQGKEVDSRHIRLRPEEAGVFFLAAVAVAVLAFLLGWYSRGLSIPAAPAGKGGGVDAGETSPGASGPARLSLTLHDEPAAGDLGRTQGFVRASSSRVHLLYTLRLAKFPAEGRAEAEAHERFLEEKGFSPVWLYPGSDGIYLCVGRFGSASDRLALEWRSRLRRLRSAYGGCRIIKLR